MCIKFKDIQATIQIQLKGKTEQELFSNLKRDVRKGISRAEKEGLEVEETQDWNNFYKIYSKTCKEGGINPEKLENLKVNNNFLMACFYKNKMVACQLLKIEDFVYNFKENKKKKAIICIVNGCLKEYFNLYPNHLLFWKIMNKYKDDCQVFDFGGYQLNTKQGEKLYSINSFKERWGGEIVKYYVYSSNPFYIFGRKLVRNFKFFRLLNNIIKKRPKNEKKS